MANKYLEQLFVVVWGMDPPSYTLDADCLSSLDHKKINSDLTFQHTKGPASVCLFTGPEGFWQDPQEGATVYVPGCEIVS